MARRGTKKNLLILNDPVSGSEVGFYYSLPTTRDHVDIAKLDGKQLSEDDLSKMLEKGLSLITGIREGDFEREVDGGGYVPISSDPASPNYFEGWRGWLIEWASDLILAFTRFIFVGQRVTAKRADEVGK